MKQEKISIKEAAELLGISENEIYYYLNTGQLEGEDGYTNGDKVYLDSVLRLLDVKNGKISPFGEMVLGTDESFKPLLSIRNQMPDAPFFFPSRQYWISNKGNVYTMPFCRKLESKIEDGYIVKSITMRGKYINIPVHRLVAVTWCDNGRFLNIVHHIDCDKKNNHKDNLLWVTDAEHGELHSLKNECEKINDLSEYYKKVDEIRTLNQQKEPYKYLIEDDNENGISILMVNEKAYNRASSGEGFDSLKPDDILIEVWVNKARAVDAMIRNRNKPKTGDDK